MFGNIMNWVTRKTGFRPDTYAIFVWMRQVNERLMYLEQNKTQGAIEQRVEFEAQTESVRDKLAARMDLLETRVAELVSK